MRVALYTRVSTREQAQGHSLDSQRKVLTRWAEQEGWEVAADYQDPGVSATSDRRPAFQAMVEAAERREFDALLVVRRDRFARNMLDARRYRERLAKCGVRVLYHDEPNVEDTPAGFLIDSNFEAYAEYYSRELSAKVKRGKAARRAKGLSNGHAPFGYNRDWTVNPAQAEAVRAVFEMYAGGGVSYVDLAQWLNARGFQTSGGVFKYSTLNFMFNNRGYLGELAGGDRGQHEAIIPVDLWHRVQIAREARSRRPRSFHRPTGRVFLLQGIGVHTCGQRLWTNPGERAHPRLLYVCSGRKRGTSCRSRGARAEVIDAQVGERIARLSLPRDWQEQVAEYLESEPGTDPQAERRRLEARIARARRALLDELVDYDTAKAAIREVEMELARLNAKPTFVAAGEKLLDLCDLWPKAAAEVKQQITRALLETVVVDLEGRQVVGADVKPPFRELFEMTGVTW